MKRPEASEGKRAGGRRWVTAKRANGALESEVLAALWTEDKPMTPGEVQRALGAELAYQTVLTTLTRLFVKGVVERSPARRGHAYRPVLGEAALTAERMRALLEGVDRAEVFQHFVEGLATDDEAALRAVIRTPRET